MLGGIQARRVLILALLVGAVLVGTAVVVTASDPTPVLLGVTDTAPISIVGDDGFANYAPLVHGSGTLLDPYVIGGLDVNASAAGEGAGIELQNTTAYVVLRGLRVHASLAPGLSVSYGIVLKNVTNVRVYSTILSDLDGNGLYVRNSQHVSIEANEFDAASVTLDGSEDVVVSGNVLDGSPLTMMGMSRVSLVANTVRLHTAGYFAAVMISGSSDVDLRANTIAMIQDGVSPEGSGVRVETSHRVVIEGNLIQDGYSGIAFLYGDDVVVRANRLTGVFLSIFTESLDWNLAPMRNVTISDNIVTGARDRAIWVEGAEGPLVRGNEVRNATIGLGLLAALNGSVASNLVSDSGLAAWVAGSTGTLFLRNTFTGYEQAVYQKEGESRWNADYPIGGNYWSNYSGPDNCGGYEQTACFGPDGIGDVPFNVSTGVVDQYPYVRPLAMPDRPPVAAVLAYPPVGRRGTEFTLVGEASSDPDGPNSGLEARWDFNGDGVWDTFWAPSLTTFHNYSVAGTQVVTVEVRDAAGYVDRATTVLVVTEPSAVTNAIFGLPREIVVSAIATPVLVAAVAFVLLRRRRADRARSSAARDLARGSGDSGLVVKKDPP